MNIHTIAVASCFTPGCSRAKRAASTFSIAEIALIGLPWTAETMLQRYPDYVDRLVAFPGYPGIPEGADNAEEQTRFLNEQRAYEYDLVIQMHGSGRTTSNALINALLGGSYMSPHSAACTG